MFTFLVDNLTPETKINIETTGTFSIPHATFWTNYLVDMPVEE